MVYYENMNTSCTDVPPQVSLKLANMAWLCAVLIVILHVLGLGPAANTGGLVFNWVVGGGLCPIAVPFFFLTSGWLFGRHVGEDGWWPRELKKRIRTILVPFAILSVIGFFGSNGVVVLTRLTNGQGLEGVFTVPGVLADFGLNPFDFPGHNVMWFLRVLLILAVFSPVLVALIRKLGIAFPLTLFLLASASQAYTYYGANTPLKMFLKTTMNETGVAFFTLGLYLQMAGKSLCLKHRSGGIFLSVGVVLLVVRFIVGTQGEWGERLALALSRPMAICMIFGMVSFMPAIRCPWAWTSFAIFVLHTYFTCLLNVTHALPPQLGLEHYLGTTFFVTALSMGSAWLLVKYCPAFATLIFGGRVKR